MTETTKKSVTKCTLLIREIRKMVQEGCLRPGDKIPSEHDLCLTYGISRITVRNALSTLVKDGDFFSIQGKGTFVSERKAKPITIGLVLQALAHDEGLGYKYYLRHTAHILRHIEEEVRKNGANVLIYFDNNDAQTERENLENIVERNLDGAIVFYIGEEENERYLKKIDSSGIPLVLIDRFVDSIDTSYVTTDNRFGADQATRSLMERGFANYYCLSTGEDVSSVLDREAGFEHAVARAGSDVCHQIMTFDCDSSQDFERQAYVFMKNAIPQMPSQFGLFAVNAATLVGVWRAIRESDLDHKQLGLACFDELPVEIAEDIFLVNVIQPVKQMAIDAVNLLFDQIRGDFHHKHISIRPEIRISSSAGSETDEALLVITPT